MSEKTRVRLGAYFLFALLLLALPVTLMVTHVSVQKKAQQWVGTPTGVKLINADHRARAVKMVQREYGLSKDGAEKFVRDHEKRTKTSLDTSHSLPYGTQIDYYTVEAAHGTETARFEGAATVLDPRSAEGKAYVAHVRETSLKKREPAYLDTLTAMLKKGTLLVPAAYSANSPSGGKFKGVGRDGTKATVQTNRVAVVATRLPGMRDIAPMGNGNSNANDTASAFWNYTTGANNPTSYTEYCYRQAAPDTPNGGGLRNYANIDTGGTDEPFIDPGNGKYYGSLFDSPGGVFSASNFGYPLGITTGRWDFADEPAEPFSVRNTNLKMQDFCFDTLYDPALYSNSTADWFYRQTHGNIKLVGDRNDVIGWLTSAHVLNRYAYQTGGGNQLFAFPGTPVIRKVPAAGVVPDDLTTHQIVRTTLSQNGCTILFNHPVAPPGSGTPVDFVMPTIMAYTQADVSEDTGTQYGTVTIDWARSAETLVMDPYDARRWTITNPGGTAWKFTQADTSSPPSLTEATWTDVDNGTWTLTYPGYTQIAGSKLNQRMGSNALDNTTISGADLNICPYNATDNSDTTPLDRPFARLKSLAYYVHAYVPGQTFQLAHLNNQWGRRDDISGTTYSVDVNTNNTGTFCKQRPAPWDHESDDPWNGGYWPRANEVNGGNHSIGAYKGDVMDVLQDNGISLIGYNTVIFANAGSAPADDHDNSSGGFQASSDLALGENLGAVTHELCHSIWGAADLYDNDLYANGLAIPPPNPLFHMSNGLGPYSIMAAGNRIDAWHTINAGFTEKTVIDKDTQGVEIPAIEGLLRDPVIIKIPGNPYYIKKTVTEGNWQEHFLLENHYGTTFDSTPEGLYIYHIEGRGCARNNANQAGFQRDDDIMSVMVEQADGNYELEFNNAGTVGNLNTDPFGGNTTANVTRFWQFPMLNGDTNDRGGVVANVNGTSGSPTSYSHGYTFSERQGGTNVLIPGTETDSFVRVVNMSNRGEVMTADVYVEPAEIKVTGVSLAPATVRQGDQNVGMMQLVMDNAQDATPGKTDQSKMSTKDVYVDTVKVLESGTSNNGVNMSAVKLYADTINIGVFDPPDPNNDATPHDSLIASTTVRTANPDKEYAVFTGVGYRVPLGTTRNMFVAYDIAPEAQTNPTITVGAEIVGPDKILPRLPGTVMVRERIDNNPNSDEDVDYYNFGNKLFPIPGNTSVVHSYPDRLVITPSTTGMPTQASQSQGDVPMLKLNCAVNPDQDPRALGSVRIDSVKVDEVGTIDAVSDLTNCKLFLDNGDGTFDAGVDTVLGTSSFTPSGGNHLAYFPNLNLQIDAGTPKVLFLAVSIASGASTDNAAQLSVKFAPTPGPQPQDDCYVQLINNVAEVNANKDFVEWDESLVTNPATWPMDSLVVEINDPNNAPGAPVAPFSPSGGQQISDTTPTLSWGAATDIDPADVPATLHYEVQVANNASFTGAINGTTADGDTDWEVPGAQALSVNTDYWWRARTVDAQDATSAWCTPQTFRVVSNRAPNQIAGGFSPTGDITTLIPAVNWNKTDDPDASDTQASLRYVLQIDDNNDFSSPLTLTNIGANATQWDSFNVPAGTNAGLSKQDQNRYKIIPGDALTYGTYYYYRVAAQDVAGSQGNWSATQTFRPIQNRKPYAPNNSFVPAGGVEVETANPVLSWGMPATPDPDVTDTLPTIHYDVQLKKGVPEDNADMTDGTIVEFTTADDVRQWVVTEDKLAAPVNLEDNGHYYWRVRAVDNQGAVGDWSSVQNFWVNLTNQKPDPVTAGFNLANGAQTNDSTPTLSWFAATDPDVSDPASTLHYVVELTSALTSASDPWGVGITQYQYTTADGVVNATATTPLTDVTTWYYRIRTVDNEGAKSAWSATQYFRLDTNNQPPTLSAGTVTPMYGSLGDYYQLFVTYTDAENDPPGKVYCDLNDGNPPLEMGKTRVDDEARDGIQYVIGIPGATLGLGAHEHAFTCDAGARLPAPAGTFDIGPVIGVGSQIWFTDVNGTPVATFQENGLIHVRVRDLDENADPLVADTVPVTVTEASGDTETFNLTETGPNTGIFRGSVPSLGRAGGADDGSLNAIGGATGNQLTADYRDPDDTANPAPDSVSTTAMLVDTVAPAAVANKLVVTSGPHGRTANLDWTTYDEAAQVDLAGYHLYWETTNFTDTTGRAVKQTMAPGEQTVVVSGLEPNKAYWFVVVPFDEVPNERTAIEPRKLVTTDVTAPEINSQQPADGTTEVQRDTTVTFYLKDDGVGVDRRTLNVTLLQNGVAIPFNQLIEGTKANLKITLTPQSLLLWNGLVSVIVDVKDLDGNQLTVPDPTWTFALVTDVEVPTIDQQTPAPNATNVPVTSTVSFHLKDTKSGVDQGSLQVLFNGVDVTGDLNVSGTPADRTIVYDPPVDLLYSSTYTVQVNVNDVAGNPLPPTTWDFATTVDATGVTVDQYNPARDETDVAVDTNVSLRLSDPQAGVNPATLRFWVHNVEVTGDPNLTITPAPAGSPTPTTVNVSYNPPADFPFSTDIRVRVYVKDGVNNTTDLTYKFRTSDAPTYSISGVITDGANPANAIAGVVVAAGGKTATTDGTGGYRISGLLEGVYTVTPAKAQFQFTPVSQNVGVGPDDATDVNFTGSQLTYTLSGVVKEGQNGLAGVDVTCNGQTATTAANGTYQITGLPNGTYTVTPSLANYHFQPTTRSALVDGAPVTGVDFQAIADTFTISGTVRDNVGNRLQGVQIACGDKAAVTNAAGQYIVTGLRAGDYVVAATKSGYSLTPATQNVTVPPSAVDVDFTAYIEMTNTFPAGINFIGVPGTPTDGNAVNAFGTPECYRWDPTSVPPRYLVAINDPTLDLVRVKPGRGFFVRYAAPTTVRVAGVPTNPAGNTSIGLSEGWNMIANPLGMPTKWSRFTPSVAGGIRPFAFVLDTATGSYKMVSADPSVSADRDSLLGWEGAWVRAVSGGVSLLLAGSGTAEAVAKPAEADLNGGWAIPITAKAGNRADFTTVAGVVPGSNGQHVVENPPTAPATVDVYFTAASGQRLAHDIRSQVGAQTYDFVVACAVPDTDVTVSLPDLSQVPADQQIMLVDKEAGKTVYARTMQAYTYHSAGEGSERSFQLVVSARTIGSLAVTAAAAAAKGDAVVVTYSVTKTCQVSVRVINLAGRTIKSLALDKPVTAGVQTQLWNLTSDAGTRVPAGTYLLQIDAASDNGQRVRGMTQVRVAR